MQGLLSQQDFWLLDLTTHKTRQLIHLRSGAAMRTFDVAPDSKHIVFDRSRENSDIVVIELNVNPGFAAANAGVSDAKAASVCSNVAMGCAAVAIMGSRACIAGSASE